MNYLQTVFILEWLAHNNINIHVIDDVDQLWSVITKDYNLYTTSSHMHNMSTSTLQTIKDFFDEFDGK